MPTVALRFTFKPNEKINHLLDACGQMTQQAVKWALDNRKTSTHTIVKALYPTFREQFPKLHSCWAQKATRTAAAIVHAFQRRQRKRRRKGEGEKEGDKGSERPRIKKVWVYVDKSTFRWEWDGEYLTVRIRVLARDKAPVVLRFRPHHKYRRYVEAWARGECDWGEPTLSRSRLIIPLKFPDLSPYAPRTLIGVDSNERSLDVFIEAGGECKLDTAYVPLVNAEHDKRIQRGCRGKHNPKAKAKIQRKHGALRRQKTEAFWHAVALRLIWMALSCGGALVVEDLKGLKGRIRGKPKRMRRRLLNQWSIRRFLRLLKDKAEVYGVPMIEVNPAYTSQTCPVCGESLRGREELVCRCGLRMNRHAVAARNIARRGKKQLPLEGTKGSLGESRKLFVRRQSLSAGRGSWVLLVALPLPLFGAVRREAQATA